MRKFIFEYKDLDPLLIVKIIDPKNEDDIILSGDVDQFESLLVWLFENTKGRFVFLGMNYLYFEREEDAMAFKLVYDNALQREVIT